MPVNITSIKTTSNGLWQGDNPLNFAFSLLIIQTTLIIVVSRFFAFLLKPLRQPKVIAEILGGVVLGPSLLGRNEHYMHTIFPKWSTPILESVASIGLVFFLFLVGLELDLSAITRGGRRSFTIAAAGVSIPFILGIGVASVFRNNIDGADKVGYAQYVVFMGVALSITAFPVLARILAELKLLTTRVGETAMAAAAFNDIAAWILLALAIALAANGAEAGAPSEHKSPWIAVWVLLTGAGFVIFMLVVIRPVMKWIGRRCTRESNAVDEAYICLTLAGVMAASLATDVIGIHPIFGAFVFGLTIPREGNFSERLIERIEDFVSGLLLPLYFASSGLKTDVTKIQGGKAWGLLVLVITTACTGKILGTFSVAMMWKIPVREALTLGVLMNTKGLVELIVLNIGKEKKVLNDEAFAILVLMALFTTFLTTPTVMAIFKPARAGLKPDSHHKLDSQSSSKLDTEEAHRVLACLHGPTEIPFLVDLIEFIRPSNSKSSLKLYAMHLVGLTERSSSIAMVQRLRKNGFPLINRLWKNEYGVLDGLVMAFQGYSQLGRVVVRPTVALSSLATMHEDVLHVAEDKRASMIIVPFHKKWRKEDGNEKEFQVEHVGHGWRVVNQRLIQDARCSLAVLVDRGFGGNSRAALVNGGVRRVCVVFAGGPDDREALSFGGRMAGHPAVKVTVVRIIKEEDGSAISLKEKEHDDVAMEYFRRNFDGTVEFKEIKVSNVKEGVLGIGKSAEYELIIVGRGQSISAGTTVEHPELGIAGDLLASSNQGILCSALVIQHHDNVEGRQDA